jgi:uncharacterized RDD family membrane protein YckC
MMKQNLHGHYAGFVSRLFAFAIDIVLIITALTVMSWFFSTVNKLLGVDNFFIRMLGPVVWQNIRIVLASLISIGVYVGYPLLFWTLTGQTPGKMLLGLRVVSTEGRYLSFGRAVRRLIGFILAALPLYVGFLWILVDDRRQGFHDKIAGTCVVYSWAAHPDETFLADMF